MDALAVKALAAEIKPVVHGATLVGARSPHSMEIVLTFRGDERLHSLLISVDARFYRAHLLPEPSSEGGSPGSHLAETLRVRARGGTCSAISVPQGERILHLTFETPELTGENKRSILIAELMGKHSNAILLDGEEIIISSLKTVQAYQSRRREVRPGKQYVPPPPLSSPDLDSLTESDMEFFKRSYEEMLLSKALPRAARRMSPLQADLLLGRTGLDGSLPLGDVDKNSLENLRREINGLLTRFEREPAALYLEAKGDPVNEHRFPVSFNIRKEIGDRAELDRFHARVRSVKSMLSAEWEKSYNLVNRLKDDLAAIPATDDLRLKADLIMCHLGTIDAHARKVRLEDIIGGSGKMMEVELKPGKTPQQTAQDLYSRAKRFIRKREAMKKRLAEVESSLAVSQNYLDQLTGLLGVSDESAAEEEFDRLVAEIIDSRLLPFDKVSRLTSDVKRLRRLMGDMKQKFPVKVHRFRTTDGLLVLVGGNDRANEFLREQVAQGTDLWFHVRGVPGSHVWLKVGEKKVTGRDLLETSHIAAFHSKARESTKVTVIHTLGKHLRKPPGSPPGTVTYVREKSLLVDPDEELVNSLRMEGNEPVA